MMSIASPWFPPIFLVILRDPGGRSEIEFMQHECMLNLIRVTEKLDLRLTLLVTNLISMQTEDFDTACGWRGITCRDNGSVSRISWGLKTDRLFDIRWLPSTVRIVEFARIEIFTACVSTKNLPRDLRFCSLIDCGLGGTIDLRTLPDKLEELHLGGNSFFGTAHLTNFPSTFTHLSFTRARFTHVVVCNELLAPQFQQASFYKMATKCSFVCLDGHTVDSRVSTKIACVSVQSVDKFNDA